MIRLAVAVALLWPSAAAAQCQGGTRGIQLDGDPYVALRLPCARLTLSWSRGYHAALDELELAVAASEAAERQILTLAEQVKQLSIVVDRKDQIANEERRGRKAAEKEGRRKKLRVILPTVIGSLGLGVGVGALVK